MMQIPPPPPLPPPLKINESSGLKTLTIPPDYLHRSSSSMISRFNFFSSSSPSPSSLSSSSSSSSSSSMVLDCRNSTPRDEDEEEGEEHEGIESDDDDDDGGDEDGDGEWGGDGRNNNQRLMMRGREFPPPIPLLARTENHPCHMPWVLKRSYEEDGRLVIKEVRVKHHEFFKAHRSNGRLVLQLMHMDVVDHHDSIPTTAVATSTSSPGEDNIDAHSVAVNGIDDDAVNLSSESDEEEENGVDDEDKIGGEGVDKEDRLRECSSYCNQHHDNHHASSSLPPTPVPILDDEEDEQKRVVDEESSIWKRMKVREPLILASSMPEGRIVGASSCQTSSSSISSCTRKSNLFRMPITASIH